MKNNDIYIATMKYAYENINDELTQEKVKSYLEDQGLLEKNETEKFSEILYFVFGEIKSLAPSSKFSMKGEAYFRYLEYIALEEARTASRRATWFAAAALFMSCISVVPQYIQCF